MCGIYCIFHFGNASNECQNVHPDTNRLLVNRGPDANCTHSIQTISCYVSFYGHVLWQQGSKISEQPVVGEKYILLFNGDIYSMRDNNNQSDTQWMSDRMNECETINEILELFRRVRGPFSMIFYDKESQSLYWLRDSLGRQTLLLGRRYDGAIIISSVIAKNDTSIEECIELPPLGLFKLNLENKSFHLYTWKELNEIRECDAQIQAVEEVLKIPCIRESAIKPDWSLAINDMTGTFNFESILSGHTKEKSDVIFNMLLQNSDIIRTCNRIIQLLSTSVRQRIFATPDYCKDCIQTRTSCEHSKIGILFSGGVDCTILACLLDKLLDPDLPIDLINVSFEKISRQKVNSISYDTPDRISARNSLIELKSLNDTRKWNLVEINVTREELNKAVTNRIRDLTNPLQSILDESLASVLWFGASGTGVCDGSQYTSPSRVLLIGSGADEIFGGYTRHRNAFLRCKEWDISPYDQLENELNLDFDRLPSRNLARDDRAIGDFGITARSPFLEEDLINFVRNLKAYQKCFHLLDQGIGDKLILRICAHIMGLKGAAVLRKKAMQFGSRIADPKQNAKDISEALR